MIFILYGMWTALQWKVLLIGEHALFCSSCSLGMNGMHMSTRHCACCSEFKRILMVIMFIHLGSGDSLECVCVCMRACVLLSVDGCGYAAMQTFTQHTHTHKHAHTCTLYTHTHTHTVRTGVKTTQ